jgi:membrane-associated phospholipid phosphatase
LSSRPQSVAATVAAVGFHPHERVAMLYFPVVCVLGVVRCAPIVQCALLLTVPLMWAALCIVENARSAPWSRVTRQYLSLAMVLIGYRSLDIVPVGASIAGQQWLDWDRALLDEIGLRALIESAGIVGPYILETVYLLLYSIPPIALTLVWLLGYKHNAHRLLLMIFAGSFAVYLLLPVFAVPSPRLAFPGVDEPNIIVLPRVINVWLLDHLDSVTGVFPSGHVAVAFSCAYGLLTAMRDRKIIWISAFVIAVLVHMATIYGRYHFAVDGAASFVIVTAVWRVTERYWRNA